MENYYYEYKRDTANDMYVFRGISTNAPRHFHRAIEMIYVESGVVGATVGDEEFTVEKDEIIFVHNYYLHSFTPREDYKKLVFIIPSTFENEVAKILKGNTLSPHLSDREFNEREIRPLVTKLFLDAKDMPRLVKKGYITIILGMLLSHYPTNPVKTPESIEFMVDILRYIDEHFKEPITLEGIAGEFGYNKCYFSRMFNKYIGDSLSNYINVVRLREFMARIRDEDAPAISKLAAECGFESMPTFYRAFAKLYGESPKSYIFKKR